MKLEDITYKDFRKFRRTMFTITHDEFGEMKGELTEVSVYPRGRKDKTLRVPFSLVFRFPADSNMPQGIYTLSHPRLGEIPVFLVPIGPDPEGMLYESIFN